MGDLKVDKLHIGSDKNLNIISTSRNVYEGKLVGEGEIAGRAFYVLVDENSVKRVVFVSCIEAIEIED